MDKLIKYLAIIPVIVLALRPPLPVDIPIFSNSLLWMWLVLISGFLSFAYFFSQAQLSIKLLVAYLFINCFFSKAPYLSFTSYFMTIICAYFYLLCLKIEDWDFIFKAVLVLFTYNIFFLVIQAFGKDSLLNFGSDKTLACSGTVGNFMQLKSLLIICVAFMLAYSKPKFIKKHIDWILCFLVACSGLYVYFHHVLNTFPTIRWAVWVKTVGLIAQHPFVGWGSGTYKAIFNAYNVKLIVSMGQGWFGSPHNEFLQEAFAHGLIGLSLMVAVIYSALRNKDVQVKLAVFFVLLVMIFHFPFRQFQCGLLLVMFLAFIQREVSYDR